MNRAVHDCSDPSRTKRAYDGDPNKASTRFLSLCEEIRYLCVIQTLSNVYNLRSCQLLAVSWIRLKGVRVENTQFPLLPELCTHTLAHTHTHTHTNRWRDVRPLERGFSFFFSPFTPALSMANTQKENSWPRCFDQKAQAICLRFRWCRPMKHSTQSAI